MRTLSLLFVSIWYCLSTYAQPKGEPIVIGHSYSIQSEILGESRPYLVYVPDDYDPNGNPTPVMYLMDGDAHFHHTTGIVTYLANQRRIPDMIVVAIPNTDDRTRDLTPPIEKDLADKERMKTAGGANKTLAFIKDELIPQIESTYNASPFRMLVGHSFGGIFVVNSLLTQPDLFDAYISISPSMWWDDQNLVGEAERFLEKQKDLEGYFYMTMGNEGNTMLGGAMKLAALFEEMAPESFGWDFKVMKEETHGSVPHRSTYYGLEAIFKDWYHVDLATLYKEGGMKAIQAHGEILQKRLGYTKAFSEGDFNNLGYALMRGGETEKAAEIFQKNIDLHPNSFNVYDSMAEAYMKMEKKEKAIELYKKSLELHPGNRNGVNMLAELGVTYDPMDQKVSLSMKKMKRYTGKYSAIQGMTLHIALENDQLMGWADPYIPKQPMISFSEELFLFTDSNISIHFDMDDKKNIVGYEAQLGIGQVAKGEKLE